MSRLMSVAFTEQAVVERRKTVTRRKGWLFVKPGDRLTLCRKVMGRKPGEPLVRIAEVEVVDVRRESLRRMLDDPEYGFDETAREGFNGTHPASWPSVFVERFFIDAQGMKADDEVTRIEWRYLDTEAGESR